MFQIGYDKKKEGWTYLSGRFTVTQITNIFFIKPFLNSFQKFSHSITRNIRECLWYPKIQQSLCIKENALKKASLYTILIV